MIVLDTSTRSFGCVLAGAKNTNDASFICSYVDEPVSGNNGPNQMAYGTTVGTTNGVTAATFAAAAGGQPNYRRRIKSLNLFNADLAAITVSIQIVDSSGPTTSIGGKYTLQTLEMLNYEEGYGFQAIDVNGAVKSQNSATSSAASTADSKAVSVSVNLSTTTSTLTIVSSLQSGASVQSFTSTTFSTISSAASLGLVVSSLQSGASAQSFTSTTFSTISSAASLGLLVSSLQSAASVQSFTSTTYSTVSSAVSRVKSSFSW